MPLAHRVVVAALTVAATAAALHAQLSFEVATIRPSNTLYEGGSMGPKPGRFVAMNVPAIALITVGHNLKHNQILGGPTWMRTDRYMIEAKTPGNVEGWDELRPMIQALLADRFTLRAHRETRPRDGYALVRVSSESLGTIDAALDVELPRPEGRAAARFALYLRLDPSAWLVHRRGYPDVDRG